MHHRLSMIVPKRADDKPSPSQPPTSPPLHANNIDLHPYPPHRSIVMSSSRSSSPQASERSSPPFSPGTDCPSPSSMPNPESSVVTKTIFRSLTSGDADTQANVTLVSSDGTRISTLRMLLITPYFQKLLNSDFAESRLPEIPVSIPSTTLRQLVEFMHTDDCELIRIMRRKTRKPVIPSSPICSVVYCNEVRALVQLADAADYTGVERLVYTCEQTLQTVMSRSPHTACTMLQLLAHRCTTWNGQLLTDALIAIQTNIDIVLLQKSDGCDLACGVMHFDERSAEMVFTQMKNSISLQQMKIFQVLLVWVSGGTALTQTPWKRLRCFGPIVVDTSKMKIVEGRRRFGKRIALNFDLNEFSAAFLSHVVETSGLLEPGAVRNAYKSASISYGRSIDQIRQEFNTQKEELVQIRLCHR